MMMPSTGKEAAKVKKGRVGSAHQKRATKEHEADFGRILKNGM
jgi:hypothetical protein